MSKLEDRPVKDFMTFSAAAKVLKITRQGVHCAVKRDYIRAIKLGYRFSLALKEDVYAYKELKK